MTLVAGQTIGAYQVIEQIGRGGMATVYKAHQPALSRYVAIKVLPTYLAEDPGFRQRFQAEAVLIAKLRHTNILQVFDYGEQEGLYYIVGEFVDGGTLADQLGSPLPPDYAAKMLAPIAGAVDYAHAREVVHRDIKPSNVLLARDGTPIVSDFGLARMMGSVRLTVTGAVVGTPEYMAPEQAGGENAGPPADRYALAVIAYEMLTGAVPYSADTPLATLMGHLHKPLPLPTARNPKLTSAIESVLLKGLAKTPEDRYESAGAFVRALELAHQGLAVVQPAPRVVAAPATVAGAAGEKRRALPVPLLAGAGAVALLVLGAVAVLATRPATPASAPTAPPAGLPAAFVTPAPTAPGATGPSAPAATQPGATPAGTRSQYGTLVYEMKLDATGSEIARREAFPDREAGEARSSAGKLELVTKKPNAGLAVHLRRTMPARFLAEVEIKIEPSTNANFTWMLRSGETSSVSLRVDGRDGTASLEYVERAAGGGPVFPEHLGDPIPVPGLAEGRAVTVAAGIVGTNWVIFVDGRPTSGSDPRLSAQAFPGLPIILQVFSQQPTTVTLTALRLHDPQ